MVKDPEDFLEGIFHFGGLSFFQHQRLCQWVNNESTMAPGDQSIGASASVLPVNIQGWFPSELTGLISLLSKDSQESSPATQFESGQEFCSHQTMNKQHTFWVVFTFISRFLCGDVYSWLAISCAQIVTESYFTWKNIEKRPPLGYWLQEICLCQSCCSWLLRAEIEALVPAMLC